MPLIYKPYQANIANKAGQKLYYPRLVKFSKMVNTQKMAELIAEKASLTPGDVHNVIRNLMSVMREQLLNSRTVRLEGEGPDEDGEPGTAQQPHSTSRRLGHIYDDRQSRRKGSRVGK